MSDLSFFQRTGDVVRTALPVGIIGQLAMAGPHNESVTVVNSIGQAAQVTTIAIPSSPANSTAYSVLINGISASYTSDGSATQAEVGAGLAAALAAEPGTRGQMTAAYSTGTLTLTGTQVNTAYTVTVSGGSGGSALGSPSTSTSAAAGTSVPFGVAVHSLGLASGTGVRVGSSPYSALFTAQVISLTFAGNTSSYYDGSVNINGKVYQWGGVKWDTDLDTTCTAIAAAINAVMPVETVIAASVGSGGGVVTLTAEVEGAEFEAIAQASGHLAAVATKAYTTGPSISTSLARALVGISGFRYNVENATIGGDDPAYTGSSAMTVHTKGSVWVSDRGLTISYGDDVFVSVASATRGYCYNAAGTDRVYIPRDKLSWGRQVSADGVAVLNVNSGVI